MFKGRSKILFIATFLATAYAIYLVCYFSGAIGSSSGSEQAGAVIASALVMPHMICFVLGAIFGWLGFFIRKAWAALVGAILYAVGTVLFLAYFMFGVPILVLGFIGFAKQKKMNLPKQAAEA